MTIQEAKDFIAAWSLLANKADYVSGDIQAYNRLLFSDANFFINLGEAIKTLGHNVEIGQDVTITDTPTFDSVILTGPGTSLTDPPEPWRNLYIDPADRKLIKSETIASLKSRLGVSGVVESRTTLTKAVSKTVIFPTSTGWSVKTQWDMTYRCYQTQGSEIEEDLRIPIKRNANGFTIAADDIPVTCTMYYIAKSVS